MRQTFFGITSVVYIPFSSLDRRFRLHPSFAAGMHSRLVVGTTKGDTNLRICVVQDFTACHREQAAS